MWRPDRPKRLARVGKVGRAWERRFLDKRVELKNDLDLEVASGLLGEAVASGLLGEAVAMA